MVRYDCFYDISNAQKPVLSFLEHWNFPLCINIQIFTLAAIRSALNETLLLDWLGWMQNWAFVAFVTKISCITVLKNKYTCSGRRILGRSACTCVLGESWNSNSRGVLYLFQNRVQGWTASRFWKPKNQNTWRSNCWVIGIYQHSYHFVVLCLAAIKLM